MPTVSRPGGVEIHWEERGEGPVVAIASMWSMYPPAFEPMVSELARDHRVVRYHDRGAGDSTPAGPYDLDTAADDLAAVIEVAGAPAVIVGTGDGPNRAIRVATRRPELVADVLAVGGAPLGRRALADADVLVSSDTVVGALLRQAETDYRGVLRSLLAAANPQQSDIELRTRMAEQVRFSPREGAVRRLRAWAEDEPLELARATGERLWVLPFEGSGGGWFPVGEELANAVRELLPDARIVPLDDGILSRPDQTAEVVRSITREPSGIRGDAATAT
jgi:pimeloyl-ACP methyl ester carboxylesterase